MQAINDYVIVDIVKEGPKKVGGLILTDEVDETNRYKKVNRSNYFKELSNSLISISPFGLGEITLKDFESFISGSILFKPNMNHMETFPNIYKDNISAVFFDWNTINLEEKIDLILSDLEFSKSLISNSQKMYNHYMNTEEGSFDFIENFKKI